LLTREIPTPILVLSVPTAGTTTERDVMTVDVIGEAVVPPEGEVDVVTVGSEAEEFWATYVAEARRETCATREDAAKGHPCWVEIQTRCGAPLDHHVVDLAHRRVGLLIAEAVTVASPYLSGRPAAHLNHLARSR
jgi:hypothetical protein